MNSRLLQVALLLFGSGFCALIYQVVWLRQFRLIFGASTAASAAVLAIFMGGLGLGGILLGPRADRHPRPLAFYALLELLIAAAALLTLFLVWLVRELYIGLGGSQTLGSTGATAVRLAFAALTLGIPTILMGGTLPAAAKAVETAADTNRRHLAVIYGVNTLGAVTGVFVATFYLLEELGIWKTLLLACTLNALVGIMARKLSRSWAARPRTAAQPSSVVSVPVEHSDAATASSLPPAKFVLIASGLVGFVFLLMELVWYRMLTPLLGGTTYTFGLILAVALLGIGLGGVAYAWLGRHREATLAAFALTCCLEAFFIALPYALGDRIACLALLLRSLGGFGFYGHVVGWTIVTSITVLPVAFVAGLQFPLLVALLGRGDKQVGRHVGLAYACNTLGAIGGSLAGGFGLLPLLTAPGAWRLVVVLLVLLGLGTLGLALREGGRRSAVVGPAVAALIALAFIFTTGPTAAWRHSPVGAGRVKLESITPNTLRHWLHQARRKVKWEWEGIESSVAVSIGHSYSFLINGKIDGNAKEDASTQVMGGLLGAILHPDPKRALVVGLGTGCTAGWLAQVDSIQRVDVVELEPAVKNVARICAEVNHNVLENDKVTLIFADAREIMLTSREHYDVIFSEPSNPYRAGIASLYTLEFYEASRRCLSDDGIFIQWLQGYEIDAQTVRTVLATLRSVYELVEVWQSQRGDLLLVATTKPLRYDIPALRRRVQTEPFKSALLAVWRTTSLEGFLTRFVVGSALADELLKLEADNINTDDLNRVEFGFARTVGRKGLFKISELRALARARGWDRPSVLRDEVGLVNWRRVEDGRISMRVVDQDLQRPEHWYNPGQRQRAQAQIDFMNGNFHGALAAWRAQTRPPGNLTELVVLSTGLAEAGDEQAEELIEKLRAWQPAEADALLARLRLQQNQLEAAATALVRAYDGFRKNPWSWDLLVLHALRTGTRLTERDASFAPRIHDAVKEPFAIYSREAERIMVHINIAQQVNSMKALPAVRALEPHIPWEKKYLQLRYLVYARASAQNPNDPELRSLTALAEEHVWQFMRTESLFLGTGLIGPAASTK